MKHKWIWPGKVKSRGCSKGPCGHASTKGWRSFSSASWSVTHPWIDWLIDWLIDCSHIFDSHKQCALIYRNKMFVFSCRKTVYFYVIYTYMYQSVSDPWRLVCLPIFYRYLQGLGIHTYTYICIYIYLSIRTYIYIYIYMCVCIVAFQSQHKN